VRRNAIIPQFGLTYEPEKLRRLAEEVERIARGAGGSLDVNVEWSQITGAPVFTSRWPTWSEVTDKPSAFPPSSHVHTFAGLTDTPGIYLGQGGRLVRVNGTETGLEFTDPEAATSIPWGSITGVPDFAARWPDWAEVTGKPIEFPPEIHGHAIADVADLQTELDSKELDLGVPTDNGHVLSSLTDGTRSWVPMSGGGSGGVLPVVTGEVPPVFVYFDDGSLLYSGVE